MLRLLYKELVSKEEYFALAIRTECEIKLPILEDLVIYFGHFLSNDDKWRFWMDNSGLRILIGTIEHIKNSSCVQENNRIPDRCLVMIANNLELISKQMAMLLPELLYNHILQWEEKITYNNNASIVEYAPNSQISLKEAKQKLSSHYQLMMDFKGYLDSPLNIVTLIQYKLPSGDNGRLHFNRERYSFMVIINDNCVEEIEASILHIIAQKIETQDFLTVGQLGLLQFLKNQASV